MTSNIDITNRALATIGTRSQITSMVDGSAEALYANLLYNDLRDFMLREGDYDFALVDIAAVPQAVPALPWTFRYSYPTDAIRIRQLIPLGFIALDPMPIEWNLLSIANVRYIVTTQAIVNILYTYPAPEDSWDAIFTESFVRLLASGLAFALENRIPASREKLQEAIAFANIANMRDP